MTDPTRSITKEPRTEREPDLVLRHEDQGPWLALSSPGRLSVHVTMKHLRERLAEMGYVIRPAQAAALPGITREQLAAAVGSALYGWADDEPNEATGYTARFEVKKVTDAILAAIEKPILPGLRSTKMKANEIEAQIVPHGPNGECSDPDLCTALIDFRLAIEAEGRTSAAEASAHGVGAVEKVGIECLCGWTCFFGRGGWIEFNRHLAALPRSAAPALDVERLSRAVADPSRPDASLPPGPPSPPPPPKDREYS